MALKRKVTMSAMLFGGAMGMLLLAEAGSSLAQALPPIRGVYTPGFNATNSGVMPEPGLTYANYFMDYSFGEFKTAKGDTIFGQGNAAVFVDVNVFELVTKRKIFGANYALAAGLPITNSQLGGSLLARATTQAPAFGLCSFVKLTSEQ